MDGWRTWRKENLERKKLIWNRKTSFNNIVGGCNNRVNDLFRVELAPLLLSHKHIILKCWAPPLRYVAGDKFHCHFLPSLGAACQGDLLYTVCSTTDTQKRHCALMMQIKQTVKNMMFFLWFEYISYILIYPIRVWCPKFTVHSNALGIIPFPVFWFMLGTSYYSHKIFSYYKILCHLFNILKGASSLSRTCSVVP